MQETPFEHIRQLLAADGKLEQDPSDHSRYMVRNADYKRVLIRNVPFLFTCEADDHISILKNHSIIITKDTITDVLPEKEVKHIEDQSYLANMGIDIEACPPGKKIKNVNMLSGGEKTMTALALVCAIISNNPSPFILFDEVDAALDEANSAKFSDIVEELSHKTQFIVITHNRAIMSRSDVLYGVTMQGDGISRLIGLKLEQAKELVKK